MPEPQFFQTAMGRTYYDHTMPRIAQAIEALAEQQAALIESITTLNANLARIADASKAKEGSP